MQFLVILMAINKMEITIGKLSTDIRILLLLALDAIPESSVREEAKPNEANASVAIKISLSWIGLFKNKVNKK
jgi:hypothetical protein